MPIIIKNCDWSQTTDEVTVKIPLLNIPTSKNLDSCISTNLIKLSYAPYYFEAFLLHPIVESCSTCLVLENEARFQLTKQDASVHWESLEKTLTKAEKMLLKEESQREIFENAKQKRQSNRQWREDKKKAEISREIHRESSMRESIEQLQEKVCLSEVAMIKPATQPAIVRTKKEVTVKVEKAPPPAIRQTGTIVVKFSGRKFITPQRESQEPLEAEWLLKQSAARKATGFDQDDLSEEQRNPKWLKDKGDDFFTKRNYLAAVSAYSTAIRLTGNKYMDALLNRAAAHFALENYQRCAEDCSAAYLLLTPPVGANLKARKQCLARRGAALCKLGYLKEGYQEFLEAVKLDPSDVNLKEDAEMVRGQLSQRIDE